MLRASAIRRRCSLEHRWRPVHSQHLPIERIEGRRRFGLELVTIDEQTIHLHVTPPAPSLDAQNHWAERSSAWKSEDRSSAVTTDGD